MVVSVHQRLVIRRLVVVSIVAVLLPVAALAQSQADSANSAAGEKATHGSGKAPQHQSSQSHHKPSQPQHKPGKPHHKPSNPHHNKPTHPQHKPANPHYKPGAPHHGGSHHGHGGSHYRPPAHRPPHYGTPPRTSEFYHEGHWYGRVHGPVYVYPSGWHYRRWPIGGHLPAVFLVPTYFYPDYVGLGLPPPPPGYNWVRYGPDLLLVNLRTGIVDDVVYGAFY
jgi:Ni/Co efflux regulator RcnB